MKLKDEFKALGFECRPRVHIHECKFGILPLLVGVYQLEIRHLRRISHTYISSSYFMGAQHFKMSHETKEINKVI